MIEVHAEVLAGLDATADDFPHVVDVEVDIPHHRVNEENNNFFDDMQLPNNIEDGGALPAMDDFALEIVIAEELKRYRHAPGLPMFNATGQHANPLTDWWLRHEVLFPHVAVIARRILAVPATSAPVERLFSAAGLTILRMIAPD